MYEVQTPVFQGPLDLLLHLVEKRQLEITKVSLLEVTEQYLEQLQRMEDLSLDAISDFLVVAAKLMFIKSLSLLPRPRSATEEEEDPGEELARQLLEYQRVKAAAEQLKALQDRGQRSYQRAVPPERPQLPPGPIEVGPLDLMRAMQRVLGRLAEQPAATVQLRAYTIADKMIEIESAVARDGTVNFSHLVETCEVRLAVIVTFLALLELIKARRVSAWQNEMFGDILVTSYRTGESTEDQESPIGPPSNP